MTSIVKHVSCNYIPQVWPKVERYLARAMDYCAGEYTLDQVKVRLVDGTQHLLVAADGDEIRGACVIVFENYPNARIAFVVAIGGRLIANQDLYAQLEHWCRANGCTKIRGAAHESVARLWKQRFDYKEVYRIVERAL